MPELDRIITLRIRPPSTTADGRPVVPEYVNHRVWAMRSTYVANTVDRGSAFAFARQNVITYRIRWREDVATAASLQQVHVIDENDLEYHTEAIREVGRRRFQDLDAGELV